MEALAKEDHHISPPSFFCPKSFCPKLPSSFFVDLARLPTIQHDKPHALTSRSSSGILPANVARASSLRMDFIWSLVVTLRFPLALRTSNVSLPFTPPSIPRLFTLSILDYINPYPMFSGPSCHAQRSRPNPKGLRSTRPIFLSPIFLSNIGSRHRRPSESASCKLITPRKLHGNPCWTRTKPGFMVANGE